MAHLLSHETVDNEMKQTVVLRSNCSQRWSSVCIEVQLLTAWLSVWSWQWGIVVAECLGYISRIGADGAGTNVGTSTCQPRGPICDVMLVWRRSGYISLAYIVNHLVCTLDDLPDALVIWMGCPDRMVENLHYQECRFTNR